jgi:hypothetical protein
MQFYSLELLENNQGLFIQPTQNRLKHGAKGKVILSHVFKDVAEQIIKENSL